MRPQDLIEAVIEADKTADAIPCELDSSGSVGRLGYRSFQVVGDSLSNVIAEGARIVVDTRGNGDRLAGMAPGSILLIRSREAGTYMLRQFLPPNLILTNRHGFNFAVTLANAPDFEVAGVVVNGSGVNA